MFLIYLFFKFILFLNVNTASAGLLHDAIRNHNLGMVEILLSQSTESLKTINEPDETTGEFPLEIAARKRNYPIIIALLKAGADPKQNSKSLQEWLSSPIELLVEFYHESRVLMIGESNHCKYQSYEYLEELLKKVGHDPLLRWILTETTSNHTELLARASVEDIPIGLKIETSDAAYLQFVFLPKLRVINQKRAESGYLPIVLVPIDGYYTQDSLLVTDEAGSVSVESWNRESGTADQLIKQITPILKSDEKLIVFYHFMHLIQGFQAELPRITEGGGITRMPLGPSNWLSIVLKKHPEWRKMMRLVFLDEIDGSWSSTTNFTLIHQLRQSIGEMPFAVNLREYPLYTPRGPELFYSLDSGDRRGVNSRVMGYFVGTPRTQEIADGLIWTPTEIVKPKDMHVYQNRL